MSDKILDLAKKFSDEMPFVYPFTEVSRKQQRRRIDAAAVILESIAGSKEDVVAMCKFFTGPSALDVGSTAANTLKNHTTLGTGAASFAKATILQVLAPHLSIHKLLECGLDVGKVSFASARKRSISGELPKHEPNQGRKEHTSARDIAALPGHPEASPYPAPVACHTFS